MADENPVLEEPKEEPTKEVSAEDQAAAVLQELEKLGIDSPEKVQNMATASSEAGNLARMLGEVKQQNLTLQQQIQQMTQPSQSQYDYNEPGLDVNAIKNAVREVYQNDILKPQMEQTNRVYGELAQIQGDENYALVSEVWDKHFNSPQTQHRIMTGQTSPSGEYNKVVMTYYREALKKTHGALKNVMEKKATPPHVEVGEQANAQTPTETEEMKDKIKKWQKSNQGGDQDIEALVKEILPADDPMFG